MAYEPNATKAAPMSFRSRPVGSLPLIASIIVGGLLVAIPAIASANGFVYASYSLTRDDVLILVAARDDLQAAQVRSSPGEIRVSFPNMSEGVQIDVQPDGEAIRAVRVRSDVNRSNVVTLSLGDQRMIPPESIQVIHGDRRAVIAIPRALLPVTTAPISSIETLKYGTISKRISPPGVPMENDDSALTLSTTRDELGLIAFLAIALLTALGYLVIKSTVNAGLVSFPGIQILDRKRLGVSHQLVIVRAMGSDYLLSISGSRTKCVATSESAPDWPFGESIPITLPVPFADRTDEPSSGVLETTSSEAGEHFEPQPTGVTAIHPPSYVSLGTSRSSSVPPAYANNYAASPSSAPISSYPPVAASTPASYAPAPGAYAPPSPASYTPHVSAPAPSSVAPSSYALASFSPGSFGLGSVPPGALMPPRDGYSDERHELDHLQSRTSGVVSKPEAQENRFGAELLRRARLADNIFELRTRALREKREADARVAQGRGHE